MTKLVLAVVATFALASVASAADLPRKTAACGYGRKAPIGKLRANIPSESIQSPRDTEGQRAQYGLVAIGTSKSA